MLAQFFAPNVELKSDLESSMRLLLLEDELELAKMITAAMVKQGMVIDHVTTIAMAQEAVASASYDAIVLDRMLPDGDSLSALPQLRKQCQGVPVIVLSALNSVEQRVEGLDTGADDYLPKPFAVDELLARIRALRRRPAEMRNETLSLGNVVYDPVHREVLVSGTHIRLPRRELLVLEALMRRSGRSVTRQTMEDAVFGYDDEIASNTLDAHISRLRRRLAERRANVEIHTIRGVGYLLRTMS